VSEIIGRDAVDVRLDELADLLRARHARKHRVQEAQRP